MVLRRKPDALTNILPTLRENPKYQGQDKLPVTVWMMAQVCTDLFLLLTKTQDYQDMIFLVIKFLNFAFAKLVTMHRPLKLIYQ